MNKRSESVVNELRFSIFCYHCFGFLTNWLNNWFKQHFVLDFRMTLSLTKCFWANSASSKSRHLTWKVYHMLMVLFIENFQFVWSTAKMKIIEDASRRVLKRKETSIFERVRGMCNIFLKRKKKCNIKGFFCWVWDSAGDRLHNTYFKVLIIHWVYLLCIAFKEMKLFLQRNGKSIAFGRRICILSCLLMFS